MNHSKPVRLQTAPTGVVESVYLFFEFTIITARSGLTNPLHMYEGGLDMSIQAERV